MQPEDLTIIVQGPLNSVSLTHLDYYRPFGKIIVACWDNDDFSLLDGLTGIEVVHCKLEQRWSYPQQTLNYHILSMYNVLSHVKTKHVIRTRSDEYWGDVSRLVQKFEEDQTRVVFGNIFFHTWRTRGFHIGDHLFVGDTDVIRNTYIRLAEEAAKYEPEYCFEISLAKAMLDQMQLPHTKDGLIRAADVVDINLLKPFVAQYQRAGIKYENNFACESVITTMDNL